MPKKILKVKKANRIYREIFSKTHITNYATQHLKLLCEYFLECGVGVISGNINSSSWAMNIVNSKELAMNLSVSI